VTCSACGHPRSKHYWRWSNGYSDKMVWGSYCRVEIADGTDKGTIACSCEGYR